MPDPQTYDEGIVAFRERLMQTDVDTFLADIEACGALIARGDMVANQQVANVLGTIKSVRSWANSAALVLLAAEDLPTPRDD